MAVAVRCPTLLAVTLVAFTVTAAPKPDPADLKTVERREKPIEPIVKIEKIAPTRSVFEKASARKPLVLKSADDAKAVFDDEAVTALAKKVDFDKHVVLVFAWRGSGQDELTFDVAESFPEQVRFRLKPGRTRDLRPHVHVYALRSNVKWSTGR